MKVEQVSGTSSVSAFAERVHRLAIAQIFARMQWLMLYGIVLTAPTSYRNVFWVVERQRPNVFLEFQGAVFFLPDYFLALLVLCTLLRALLDRGYAASLLDTARNFISHFGGVFWLIWLIWIEIGAIWAVAPNLVHYETLELAAALLMALVIATFLRDERNTYNGTILLGILVIGAAAQGALALAQTLHGGPVGLGQLGELAGTWTVPGGVYRGSGLTVNPNNLAGYLLIALFACLQVANLGNHSVQPLPAGSPSPFAERGSGGEVNERRFIGFGLIRGIALVCGAMIVAGLLSSMSRSTLIGLAAGLAPVIIVGLLRRRPGVRLAVIGALIVGLLLALALALVLNAQNRLIYFFDRDFRFEYTDEVIARAPVLGVGANNLMLHINDNHVWDAPYLLPVHNMYWMMWAELGIPGVLLFVAGAFYVLRDLRRTRDLALLTWTGCFLAICVAMLFDYYFWGDNRSRLLMFAVVGLWLGQRLATRNTELAENKADSGGASSIAQ